MGTKTLREEQNNKKKTFNCDTLNFEIKLYTVPEHLRTIQDFSGIHVVRFVKLHAFTFLVPYYDVHYDFCEGTMLNSSLCPFYYYKMGAWKIRAPTVLIQT